MKHLPSLAAGFSLCFAGFAWGHDPGGGDHEHPRYDRSVRPPDAVVSGWYPVVADSGRAQPALARIFAAFAPRVNVRWDEKFLFVESSGLPEHGLMKGITNWQQQVPVPQDYTGANAWRLPLVPVPAKEPAMIKGRFLRGAIALAANGVPIFNPQNNRGEVSAEIGELDEWGGHCGRADDYHYHAAPLHLQDKVGKGRPIAVALDGYPVYGLTEPDGGIPAGLDFCHGHDSPVLGYHYHAATRYPYVNGGFHGEVVEAGGQVDPQPNAQPGRGAGSPLRGARITGFEVTGKEAYKLGYEVGGEKRAIVYSVNADRSLAFEYQNGKSGTTKETYTRRAAGGGGEGQRPAGDGRPPREERGAPELSVSDLKKTGGFILRSPVVADGGALPIEFTGDGSGISPPLEWSGAPAGTKGYALIMHHVPGPGEVKWYWTLYGLPADLTNLPKGVKGIGTSGGNSINRVTGYAPPHSKGPGAKTYVLTLYALSEPLRIDVPAAQVSRDVLLVAMKGKVLASSELHVVYSREGAASPPRGRTDAAAPPAGGLSKATMADTMKGEIYADNWFALYVNGRLTVVDPIAFLPHNVVSVDLLPEYPMTLAVIAHDNADPKTGLEYGNHIGDAGFILKFADGTVTDGSWKVRSLERGPMGGDLKNPRVEVVARPVNWFATDFDDGKWENATVYSEEQVSPKAAYFEHDFKDARFIWSKELGLDNTVLFRKRIEKPGWTPRSVAPAGPLPQP